MKKILPVKDKIKKRPAVFPLVGIGASAGGLEAVTELLKNLSPGTGMAYIYIQHLNPEHESMLPDILSKATKMPVAEAKNHIHIEPDHVYILPPDKDMVVEDGMLKLSERAARPILHNPINTFFISLAEKRKQGAIGIVLSGNASDGSAGLKAIKAAGGFTFAQDETAKFQSMPKSAIAEGAVDFILSPKEIAKELERFSKHTGLLQTMMSEKEDGDLPGENSEEELNAILRLLKKSTDVDFSYYKKNTINRRILRRMLLHKIPSFKEYLRFLKQHTAEIGVLYQDLLINVTSFFRDPDANEYLKKTLLPRLLKDKNGNDPVRIWVPACSTGEEAYSLAILLLEVLGNRAAAIAIQIFATDLSETAIAKARLGLYSPNELLGVSPQRLQRFFTKVDGSYRILKSIRDLCVFAPHNIFKDPPFSRLDLISCCNLLIYLEPVLQKKVISTFHYALNNNGHLLLGKAETIGASQNLFTAVDKKLKIYSRKKDTNARAFFDMTSKLPESEKYQVIRNKVKEPFTKEQHSSSDMETSVDHILLNRYVPACVVVSQDLEIMQFRGSTSQFLEPSPGKASLNLLKMARPGLAFELRSAVHKASKSGETVKKTGIELKNKNSSQLVNIEVAPLNTDGERRFLVLFEEYVVPKASRSILSRDQKVKQLEQELTTTREDMRSIVEEQEAVNEELQSANEEIVSSNEELQSINEELETSKEEVESTNEELTTVNQEMLLRNEQLAEAYEYSETIIGTVREAVLVIDQSLRVKSANNAFYKTFRTREEDTEGKLIYELGNGQWNIPKLRELLEDILPQRTVVYGFEVRHVFPEVGEKIMLLDAKGIVQKTHHEQIILLVINDITEYVSAQKTIQDREAWFREMANNAPVLIWTAGPDKLPTFFNKTWLEYTGRSVEQEVGMGWLEDVHPDDLEKVLDVYNSAFEEKKPYKIEYRLRRHDGEFRWILSKGIPTFTPDNSFTGFIGTSTEVHDQHTLNQELDATVKARTRELIKANANLENSNVELKQFAFIASHDLQEPLRKISTFGDLLKNSIDDNVSAESKQFLEKIIASTQRMSRLIEDVLNFSSVLKHDEQFEETDLSIILDKTLKDFDHDIVERKVVINQHKLPVIEGIPIRINQLFHNLISNALKFTSKRQVPEITIASRKLELKEIQSYPLLDQGLEYCEIMVKDNGIGFEPEYSEKVFVIFQRLNARHEYPGTGIGLALCQKIVNNHHGLIFAKAELNKGASFHIILPVKQAKS